MFRIIYMRRSHYYSVILSTEAVCRKNDIGSGANCRMDKKSFITKE